MADKKKGGYRSTCGGMEPYRSVPEPKSDKSGKAKKPKKGAK